MNGDAMDSTAGGMLYKWGTHRETWRIAARTVRNGPQATSLVALPDHNWKIKLGDALATATDLAKEPIRNKH